ncbi:kinase phosphorylation protein-domain-containing protein [Russula dissimulans]|nr:kinase phosphorylation protein-domain-containing protein [Russula dissimulans]
MFEPIRGGTRGGQAEFKWSDVSADKDRENYLGHSINAPTGRWQKNKDVHWYNRETNDSKDERLKEIRKIKEAEAEALSVALYVPIVLPLLYVHWYLYSGFGSSKKESTQSAPGTGTNAIPIPSPSAVGAHVSPDKDAKAAEKAERKRRRVERREEKAARKAGKAAYKERRHAHYSRYHDDSPHRSPTPVRRQRDSRSPSPNRHRSPSRDNPRDGRYRRSRDRLSPDGGRLRDRSPHRRDSRSHSELPPRRPPPRNNYYDGEKREGESSRERQRWDHNAR